MGGAKELFDGVLNEVRKFVEFEREKKGVLGYLKNSYVNHCVDGCLWDFCESGDAKKRKDAKNILEQSLSGKYGNEAKRLAIEIIASIIRKNIFSETIITDHEEWDYAVKMLNRFLEPKDETCEHKAGVPWPKTIATGIVNAYLIGKGMGDAEKNILTDLALSDDKNDPAVSKKYYFAVSIMRKCLARECSIENQETAIDLMNERVLPGSQYNYTPDSELGKVVQYHIEMGYDNTTGKYEDTKTITAVMTVLKTESPAAHNLMALLPRINHRGVIDNMVTQVFSNWEHDSLEGVMDSLFSMLDRENGSPQKQAAWGIICEKFVIAEKEPFSGGMNLFLSKTILAMEGEYGERAKDAAIKIAAGFLDKNKEADALLNIIKARIAGGGGKKILPALEKLALTVHKRTLNSIIKMAAKEYADWMIGDSREYMGHGGYKEVMKKTVKLLNHSGAHFPAALKDLVKKTQEVKREHPKKLLRAA